jgi:hypothetical protein
VVPTPPATAPKPAPSAAAPAPPPRPEDQKVANAVTITETTIADVGDLRIGVSNVWEDSFTDAEGKSQRGPTAMMSVADQTGRDLHRERVHVGSAVTVAGHRIVVQNVHAPESGRGSLTLAVEPGAEKGTP